MFVSGYWTFLNTNTHTNTRLAPPEATSIDINFLIAARHNLKNHPLNHFRLIIVLQCCQHVHLLAHIQPALAPWILQLQWSKIIP